VRTLVDTCVLSEVQRPKGDPRVRARLAALAEDDIYLSVLSMGEIRKGIDKLRPSARKRSLNAWHAQLTMTAAERILAIDLEAALIWGEIAAKAEKRGRPIPSIDGLIAATALRHGLRVMTRNVSDFEPTGVLLINPWEDE